MAEADIEASRQQLLDPGDTAAFRVVIETPLQMDIDQWIGDKVDIRHLQKPEQPRGIGTIVGVHGGGVAGGDPPPQAIALGEPG